MFINTLFLFFPMKKIIVFGSFDILHKGHFYFLKQAKSYGNYLIVVLARDKTIEQLKNRKPLNNEKKRKANLEKIDIVDKVLLGNLKDKYKVIEEQKPDIICLGYDQKFFVNSLKQELAKRNLNIKIVKLKPYKPEIYKSSKLKTKNHSKI